jgi:hypothetical protein
VHANYAAPSHSVYHERLRQYNPPPPGVDADEAGHQNSQRGHETITTTLLVSLTAPWPCSGTLQRATFPVDPDQTLACNEACRPAAADLDGDGSTCKFRGMGWGGGILCMFCERGDMALGSGGSLVERRACMSISLFIPSQHKRRVPLLVAPRRV